MHVPWRKFSVRLAINRVDENRAAFKLCHVMPLEFGISA
jgi:hypothetical protein